MACHTTYSVFAPPAKLQTLADALNAPRNPEDQTIEPGLGPNTCRSDASTYPSLGESPNAPAKHRRFKLSVRPDDRDRFKTICDRISGVRYAEYHSEDDSIDCDSPGEHFRAKGLDRVPEEAV